MGARRRSIGDAVDRAAWCRDRWRGRRCGRAHLVSSLSQRGLQPRGKPRSETTMSALAHAAVIVAQSIRVGRSRRQQPPFRAVLAEQRDAGIVRASRCRLRHRGCPGRRRTPKPPQAGCGHNRPHGRAGSAACRRRPPPGAARRRSPAGPATARTHAPTRADAQPVTSPNSRTRACPEAQPDATANHGSERPGRH